MLTLDEIRARLHDRNLSKVAEATGCTRAYLSQIRQGKADNPGYQVIKALSDYLQANQ